MSFYHGAKARVRVGFELSEEFWVQVGVHQKSVPSPLLFPIVVNVNTENTREDLMNKIFVCI